MRRDICYFFAADVQSVYNAYLTAASNQKFRRECAQEPYHTLSFGLNFSMKYNMNGGSCTIHFIPYNGGTAVDLRFSIAQLAGARYERYATDLTNDTVAVLGVPAQRTNISINEFTNDLNKVTPSSMPRTAPAYEPAPANMNSTQTPPAAPDVVYSQTIFSAPQTNASHFCANCGKALNESDLFCSGCGTRVAPKGNTCSRCGAKVADGSSFCSNCGNKLN